MKECPNCGSNNLSLSAVPVNTSNVVDGRLKMHDVAVRFVLGCDECSETVKTLREDQVQLVLVS